MEEQPNTPTEPKRPGAPAGNASAQRHGLRTWRERRQMPRGANLEERELAEERQRLTEAVKQRHGEIPAHAHGLIEATLTHRGRMLLAERYRRTSKLTMAEKLALSQEAGRAAESYTRALAQLGLTGSAGSDGDPWAAAMAGVADSWAEHAMEGSGDGQDATTEAASAHAAGSRDTSQDRSTSMEDGST